MSVEFDPYKFENKIRDMVLDLVSPNTKRLIGLQETLEELLRHDAQHKKRLDGLNFSFLNVQGKISLIEEVYKASQELKASNASFQAEANHQIEVIAGNVEKAMNKLDDLNMKIAVLDDNYKNSRSEISEYTNTINTLNDNIINDHKNLVKYVDKTIFDIKNLWKSAETRLEKSEFAVLAFTDKSLPKMMADVESNWRAFKEFQKETTDALETKAHKSSLVDLKRNFKYENDKIYQVIKTINDNHDKIEEYLDNYLPIERLNSISEAVCQLDPKYLRKFIEYEERLMENYRNNVQQEHMDIDGMSNRVLEIYNLCISRREVMKIEIEKAELEERAAQNRARNNSSRKKQDSSKSKKHKIIKNSHDLEPASAFDHENPKKNTGNISTGKNEPESIQTEVEIVQNINELPPALENKDNTAEPEVINPPVTVAKDQSIPLISPQNLPDGINAAIIKDQSVQLINSQDVPDSVNSQSGLLLNNNSSRPPTQSVKDQSVVNPSPLAEKSSTFKLIKQESSDYEVESLLSPSPVIENSSPEYSPEYSPSIDIAKIETDLEDLKKQLEDTKSVTETLKQEFEASTKTSETISSTISTSISHFQTEITTNLHLMDEEIKQLVLRNKQDKIDISKHMSLFHKELISNSKSIENIENKMISLNELLVNLSEIGKIISLITQQEEDDRQSLHLLGYAESKGNKPYISLKSDCMSCSGQNPVIMTAFKMACLNYSPSSVKYRHRTYTRKQMISVLASVAASAWAQATSKTPRHSTDFGSYQSIPSLIEDSGASSKKPRYNKSQYIELPSLNNSKLLFDSNETPVSSTREIKKL